MCSGSHYFLQVRSPVAERVQSSFRYRHQSGHHLPTRERELHELHRDSYELAEKGATLNTIDIIELASDFVRLGPTIEMVATLHCIEKDAFIINKVS